MVTRHINGAIVEPYAIDSLLGRNRMTDNTMDRSPSRLGPTLATPQFIGFFFIWTIFAFHATPTTLFQCMKFIYPNTDLLSHGSHKNRSIARHRVAIYDFRHTLRGASRILCIWSIKVLNRSLGKENLFTTIRSDGCGQRLETNFKGTRTKLAIE